MTTQTNPRARVNMLLSAVHNAAVVFFAGVGYAIMAVVFLCAIAAFAIPVAHHVWGFWSGLASSYQAASAPVAKPAAAQKK